MPLVVYYSSVSENTRRFVDKLALDNRRIPLRASEGPLAVRRPYVLIVPTYCGDDGRGGVPKPVIRFLNDPLNRQGIRGVIAAGNTNFGHHFCKSGSIVSAKCGVPYLDRFELMGTAEDVDRIRSGLERFWSRPQ
ncbi:class Ib ribonucleoside-diphosphate reductase assembly flavoprotein NrdI [Brevundimonas diminuta]|uniref:class Ib ribonucleoside-diphosphate reductase assembly flavoprotein NrdI n=1 Tax=Brevundimonas diminuta TaxID=293 RepID=UPI003CFC215E